MGSRSQLVYGIHAACMFLGAGGGGSFDRQRGFLAAFVRNGAGDYSLALQDAIDNTPAQNYLMCSGMAGAVSQTDAAIVDATHVRVRTAQGAQVATDGRFALEVRDFGPN